MSDTNADGTYHSKHNVRGVPVRTDGLAAKYYPEWLLVRIAVDLARNGSRYPVKFDPSVTAGEFCTLQAEIDSESGGSDHE